MLLGSRLTAITVLTVQTELTVVYLKGSEAKGGSVLNRASSPPTSRGRLLEVRVNNPTPSIQHDPPN